MSLKQLDRSALNWRLLLLLPLASWRVSSPRPALWSPISAQTAPHVDLTQIRVARSVRPSPDAAPNEVIYVGAGRYGDVNGTGAFTGPGDEHAQPAAGNGAEYQSCVICISKPVQIYSNNGSAVTFIQANSAATFQNAVFITSAGVTFGSPGHGFTINNGGGNGVVVDFENTRASTQPMNVTIAGNVDVGDAQGFVFVGSYNGVPPASSLCPALDCPPGYHGRILFQGNRASGSGIGFWIEPLTTNCCGRESLSTVNGQLVYRLITTSRLSWKTTSRFLRSTGFFCRKGYRHLRRLWRPCDG